MFIIDKNKFASLSDQDKNKICITDANGKKFEVDISSLNDASTIATTDANIQDSLGDISDKNFAVTVTDSEGKVMEPSQAITVIENGQASHVEALFEATHTGLNNNYGVYTSESMMNDAQTFMSPFCKPLLKNHDDFSEPLGRVKNSEFGESEFCENKDTINVTYDVRDRDAMLKLADGRYKTVSIGANANTIRCNVCGKNILKDGTFKFCGHWRGEKYGEQKCSWTYENLTYGETSIVNKPADQLAQLKGLKVFLKNGSSTSQDGDTKTPNVLDGIDTELGITNKGGTPNEPGNPTPNEPKDGEQQKDPENPGDPKDGESSNVNSDIKKLKDQIQTLENSNALLSEENKTLKEDKVKLENKIQNSVNENTQKVNELNNKVHDLSSLNRQLLEDFAVFKVPSMSSIVKDKTSTELYNAIKAPTRRTVDNPGAGIDDKHVENGQKKEKKTFASIIEKSI